MTKEEAIRILENYKPEVKRATLAAKRAKEALDMAISALSAPSVNVISIDQANAMIKSYVSHYEENKGEWICIDEEDDKLNRYKCSRCGEIIKLSDKETLHDYPFSHCGADMRGE